MKPIGVKNGASRSDHVDWRDQAGWGTMKGKKGTKMAKWIKRSGVGWDGGGGEAQKKGNKKGWKKIDEKKAMTAKHLASLAKCDTYPTYLTQYLSPWLEWTPIRPIETYTFGLLLKMNTYTPLSNPIDLGLFQANSHGPLSDP